MKRLSPLLILLMMLGNGCLDRNESTPNQTQTESSSELLENDASSSTTQPRSGARHEACAELNIKAGQSVEEAKKQVKVFGGYWSKGRLFAMTEGLGASRYRTFHVPFGPSGYLVITPDQTDVEEIHFLTYPPRVKGNENWHETEQLKWGPNACIRVGEKLSVARKNVKAAGGIWMQPAQFEDEIAEVTCANPSMSAGFTVMETEAGPNEDSKRGVLLCADDKERRITEIKTHSRLQQSGGNWRTAKIVPIPGTEKPVDTRSNKKDDDQKKVGPKSHMPVKQAIEGVDQPRAAGSTGPGGVTGQLQVEYRLKWLRYGTSYKYDREDDEAWLNCMRNPERSMYARICASHFLLDRHKEARTFITSVLRSEHLRHRYNAAEIVRRYVDDDPNKKWGINVLIKLLADGSIDGGVTGYPNGQYPEGDRYDIKRTPIEKICGDLGDMKFKRAVPALISVLKRRPETKAAAFALGEIGDKRAVPVLKEIVKDRSGCVSCALALSKLKPNEAVPILTSLLNKQRSRTETEEILDALLRIGDDRAIDAIETYLKGDHRKESKANARRVLVQLTSSDPVEPLLSLLEETDKWQEQRDIMSALVRHADERVVKKFASLARTSNSAYLRHKAIAGLTDIGNRQSLLVLASLLDATFPENLTPGVFTRERGKEPDFQTYFPELIHKNLKSVTNQDFGKDRARWEAWIKKNIGSEEALEKK